MTHTSLQSAPRRKALRILARAAALIPLVCAVSWSSAALWIDGPESRWLAGMEAAALLIVGAGAFWFTRHFWRAVLFNIGMVGLVSAWWLQIPPRNDRNWRPDVARLATV